MPVKINKSISVSGITPPFTYTFSNANPNVSFSNQTGTSSSSTVSTDIIFPTTTEVATTITKVTIVDSKGCSTIKTLNTLNPCNVTIPSLTVSGYKVVATAASSGCSGATFVWAYDGGVFSLDNQTDSSFTSTASFKPKANSVLPYASVVELTATDCYGCTVKSRVSVPISAPALSLSNNINIACKNTSGLYTSTAYVTAPTGSNLIDWATLDVGFTGINVWNVEVTTITDIANNRSAQITFFTSQSPVVESANFTVYVNDKYGVATSLSGTITVSACNQVGGIINSNITPISAKVASTITSGTIIPIDVTNSLNTLSTIDWSSAQVLSTPAYASPSITFATTSALRQIINYEYAGTSDLFAWTVDDINGNTLPPSTVSITTLPTAPVANTDNLSVVAGSTTVITPLSNDTSAAGLNVASIRVTQQSTTGGLATANIDGTITYVSDETDFGNALFRYKVNDIYNQESNNAGIVITRISAGNNGAANKCATTAQTLTFSLFDLLTNGIRVITPGGTWTNLGTASPSPAAPGIYSGTVSFTQGTHAVGDHTYRYSVTSGSATDTKDVVISFYSYGVPSNNECAAATSISFGGKGTSTTTTTQNLDATCPGFAAATLSATVLPSSWGSSTFVSDVWYTFTASPSYDVLTGTYLTYPIAVTLAGNNFSITDGIYAPALALYSGTCGALVEENSSLANVSSQNITGQVTMSGSTSKTFIIRVSAISGYEGKYTLNLTA